MSKVIIVGGGAAGMMAAVFAARNKKEVVLVEQNEKLGKKLFITGKGRCNFTNACETEDLFANVVTNPKFLYSAFYSFSNRMVIDFFEEIGLPCKIERGNRVFPVSDRSSDVIRALEKELKKQKVKIMLNTKVKSLILEKNICKGVELVKWGTLYADSVIIATGGISYPRTGACPDGYAFARCAGHTVSDILPSLVPFELQDGCCKDLMGISLKNVSACIYEEGKKVYSDFGEMLFTHFGVSGPIIIKASAYLHKYLGQKLELTIDLKPALDEKQLDERILRDFKLFQNKQLKNSLDKLLLHALIPVVVEKSGLDGEKKVNELTKEERRRLGETIKRLPFTITGLRGFDEAIVTKGGVQVKEIDPGTMESKLTGGLYFAGEVLDLDALTGGYNLQIAWSTGYLAGISC
ncbi:MAG: NAD(P)/FAD-dependent oxidoreductase [Bacteroidales bacterium]|nr:NAD(P)/FAD-dependent oxidoreductase [Clostridium sp.]MCM1203097.1 NAD(P)/FAD-dependent oxidoreductase [Bacteroidales bacterium]